MLHCSEKYKDLWLEKSPDPFTESILKIEGEEKKLNQNPF
jgi:hypothetical protein